MISDGTRVCFIGNDPSSSNLTYDDQGVVLAAAGKTAAHVKWDNGVFTMTDWLDLSPIKNSTRVESELDDSLDVSGLSQHTAAAIFNERGPEGLLEALEESGALSVYEDPLQEAVDTLIAVIARAGWLKKLDDDSRSDMALLVAKELIKKFD